MRRIDPSCLLLAPLVVGLLLYLGSFWGAAATVAWNLVAWAPEVALVSAAHRRSANLRCVWIRASPARQVACTEHPGVMERSCVVCASNVM